MTPLTGTQRARQDLLNTFTEFNLLANENLMIATKVFPVLRVPLAFGQYPWLPIKELLKRQATAAANAQGYAGVRAPGGGYPRSGIAFGEKSYKTQEHGFEGIIDENEAAVFADHFEHEVTTASKTYHDLMLERELRTASLLFSTTTFPTNAGIGFSQEAGTYRKDGSYVQGNAVPWSDADNSDPVTDVWQSKQKVFNRTGRYPTSMAINELTLRHLRVNTMIRDEWIAQGVARGIQRDLAIFDHNTSMGHMDSSTTAIAAVLDLDEILVGSSILDGNADANGAFQAQHAWTNDALVFRRIRGSGPASLSEVGLGHTILWDRDISGSNTSTANTHGMSVAEGVFVEDYYTDEIRAQIIRARHQDEAHLKYVEAGELILDVT